MKTHKKTIPLHSDFPVSTGDTYPDRVVSKDKFDGIKFINSIAKLPKNKQELKHPELVRWLAQENPLIADGLVDYASKKGICKKTPLNNEIKSYRASIKKQNRSKRLSNYPTDTGLADRWIAEHPDTLHAFGKNKRYKDGIWNDIHIDEIKKEFTALLETSQEQEGLHLTIHKFKSIFEFARIKIADEKGWEPNPNLLPLTNGVYDLSEMRFLPPNPAYRFTYHLGFAYDKKADCPNFKKMLSRIPQWSNTIQKFAGYCLTVDMKYETALWFYGPPGSGKSMILRALQLVLGPLAGELGLHDIQWNRFSLAKILGKRLVVSTEQPNGYINAADILNILISGELKGMENKYKDPFSATSESKIAWASNESPRIRNFFNNGLSRRLLIIPMPPLPPEERDVDLLSKLMGELPGIFNYALEGLKILRVEKGFEDGIELSKKDNKYMMTDDKLSSFIEEKCSVGIGEKIQSTVLYQAFESYCIEKGITCPSMKRLASEWEQLGFTNSTINGRSFWHGVSLIKQI